MPWGWWPSALQLTDWAVPCLLWIVIVIVILRPSQSPVAWAMSSSTFFGDRPGRRILEVRAAVALTSHRCSLCIQVGFKLRWHGGSGWCQMNPDAGQLKKAAPRPSLIQTQKYLLEFFMTFSLLKVERRTCLLFTNSFSSDPSVPIAWNFPLYSWNPETKITWKKVFVFN